jgi:hypothetical protein
MGESHGIGAGPGGLAGGAGAFGAEGAAAAGFGSPPGDGDEGDLVSSGIQNVQTYGVAALAGNVNF